MKERKNQNFGFNIGEKFKLTLISYKTKFWYK